MWPRIFWNFRKLSASLTDSDNFHFVPVSRFGLDELTTGSRESLSWRRELVLDVLNREEELRVLLDTPPWM